MRLSYARQAIHDATAIGIRSGDDADQIKYGCRIQRSAVSSSNNRILDVTEAGRILKSIEKCGQVIEAWLMYAYAAEPEKMSHYNFVIEHIFGNEFEKEPRHRWHRIVHLIEMAMDDYRMRMNTGRSVPIVAYCSHMINEDGKPLLEPHFVRDGWATKARTVHKLLEVLDRTGVIAVAEEVRILAGEQAREQVLKPVTVWKRGCLRDDGAMRWEHNHIEDGHVTDALPRPIYIEQVKSWSGADGWEKTFSYMDENGRIV